MNHMASASLFAVNSLVSIACIGAPLSSDGDPRATFDRGFFNLPDLESPKDSYIVIITVDGAAEPITLTLPQGAPGLRVSQSAVPSGTWRWRYKVTKDKPGPLTVLTAENVSVPADALRDGFYILEWKPVEGAKKYQITGRTRQKSEAQDAPPWEKLPPVECFASVCARNPTASKPLALKAGTDVEWQVAALDADGIPIAKSSIHKIEVQQAQPTWVESATKAGFKFQRSDTLSKEAASQPAVFGYLSSQKGSTTRNGAYQAEFAIIWDGPTASTWGFYPRATLEGHLTSNGEQKTGDAVRLRYGGYKLLHGHTPGEGSELTANLKYETARKSGTKKGLIEFGWTPIYGFLGRYWPGPPKLGQADPSGNYRTLPWFQAAPLIQFGVEAGKTFDVGSSSETRETVLRYRATARLDTEFNFLATALGARNVSGFAGITYWRLPRETNDEYRHASTGISFGLTEEISFNLSYSVGREPPEFTFARKGNVGLGIKF